VKTIQLDVATEAAEELLGDLQCVAIAETPADELRELEQALTDVRALQDLLSTLATAARRAVNR
jgi:hypothetical protein